MKTLAVRLYGVNDLRLERFDLPEIKDDEILADIVTNSICMSDYKATIQGAAHKRVPEDIATRPIIIGHEFCGRLLKIGKRWQGKYNVGQKFGIQPQLNIPGHEFMAPGYSFPYIGGEATRIIIPSVVMEQDCLLTYSGDAFYKSSISEPVSCVIGGFRSSYHYSAGEYTHHMGLKNKGAMALIAGAGPMGLSAVDMALHGPENRPAILVVTDIDDARLARAASLFPPDKAREVGVELHFVNTNVADPVAYVKSFNNNRGFDDVFVFAPVPALVEQGSALLGYLGCLNFFAGPSKSEFKAPINFYDVHYMGHHVVGSSGGNTKDLQDAMDYAAEGRIKPAIMITHVGGIDSVPDATKNLPGIPGGKKLIYTHVSMPLTAISDFSKLGGKDPFYAALAEICGKNNDLWSKEAEEYVLTHAKRLEEDAVLQEVK